jgi:hypothetical protein
MSDLSYFESRKGKIVSSAEDIFSFVTDLRNFAQFAPEGTITNWTAEREICSFSVPMLGTVGFKIKEKEPHTRVIYEGDALKKNDFVISLHITETGHELSDIIISLNADLNPMMKMMAASPINQFLEIIVKEMESFKGWKQVR